MRTLLLASVLSASACTTDPLEPPTGKVVDYTMTQELLPLTNTEARDHAVDLNGDGAVDNQLGMVISTLSGQGLDATKDTDKAIASGELTLHTELHYPAAESQGVALSLWSGSTAASEPLLADPSALPFDFGPSELTVPISFYGEIEQLDLVGTRVVVDHADTGGFTATIAGGLRTSEVETKLAPRFAAMLDELVAAQCAGGDAASGCGCRSGTDPYAWLVMFDTSPKDCTVTTQEVLNNEIVKSLVMPDITIDGEQVLSIGFGVAGTPSTH